LIVRGKKYHPHDLEATVADRVDGLTLGRVLAGGWEDEGEPRTVMIVEPPAPLDQLDGDALMREVQAAVRRDHGISVEGVLLERGRIPKTSSGKLRRQEAVARLRAGDLQPLATTPSVRSWVASSSTYSQVAGEPVPSQLDAHAAASQLEAEPGHDQVLAHLL